MVAQKMLRPCVGNQAFLGNNLNFKLLAMEMPETIIFYTRVYACATYSELYKFHDPDREISCQMPDLTITRRGTSIIKFEAFFLQYLNSIVG